MDAFLLAARLLLLLGVANTAPIGAKLLLGDRWSAPLDAGWRFRDGRPLLAVHGVLGLSLLQVAAITALFFALEIPLARLFFRFGMRDRPY